MHSSVLQNKKYIKFSNQNTVEVMSMSSLDRGIESEDRRASTYKTKNERGEVVEYLVEFPGLTIEQVNALAKSPARQFNTSRRIPYTSIVDPHTLEEIQGWLGGQAASTLMDGVKKARRRLDKEHGKGVSRRMLDAITKADHGIHKAIATDDLVDAVKIATDLAKEVAKESRVADRMAEVQGKVLASVHAHLSGSPTSDGVDAKLERALEKLAKALQDSPLGPKVRELIGTGSR